MFHPASGRAEIFLLFFFLLLFSLLKLRGSRTDGFGLGSQLGAALAKPRGGRGVKSRPVHTLPKLGAPQEAPPGSPPAPRQAWAFSFLLLKHLPPRPGAP